MTSALLITFITKYSYLALYFILGISILGLPIPDEFLLTFVGFLSYSGKVSLVLAVLSAAAGSMTGITIAYFLGRFLKTKVLTHLEKHAGAERLEKVLHWYHRQGRKLLIIGYFIPGVRHLSGYVSGLSRLSYRDFAVFAYLGALLWTSLFISLGRMLGTQWQPLLPLIHRYSLLLGVTALVLFIAFYMLYKNHERLGAWLTEELTRFPERYRSLGKQRLIITLGGILFLILFVFLMGMVQDFVANEVGEFDELVVSWLEITSPNFVIQFMQGINALGTHAVLFILFLMTGFFLWVETKRWSHLLPLVLAWGGGTIIDQLFRWIFHGKNINVFENISPFQAPSTGFLLAALSFYAVMGYLIGRKSSRGMQFVLLIAEVLLLILLGLSPVYLRIHTPSAMVTALTVSGLWSLVCVFSYEFLIYKKEFNPQLIS